MLRKTTLLYFLLIATAVTFNAWAQSPEDAPLVQIVSPRFEQTISDSNVSVLVHLHDVDEPTSLHSEINGRDISNYFEFGRCPSSADCEMKAIVPDWELRPGSNVLVVTATGPNQSVGAERTRFEYAGPFAQGDVVTHFIPAVAVQSVYLPPTADASVPGNYQIIVGPGPGFARRTYSPAGLTCSAGINSMQVLVLQRTNLAPDPKVGNGSGQACLGDANSLTTFLKGLPTGDLVIANSFIGVMPNLDTRAVGGTKYAGTNVTPYYYSIIGAAGAAEGSAYESWEPRNRGGDYLAPLIGSLMLDIRQNYSFAPSSHPEVKVIPDDPSLPRSVMITYQGHPYVYPLPATTRGAFVILAIDRRLDRVWDHYFLPTNDANEATSKQALAALNYLLNAYYKPEDLLVITVEGAPFASAGFVSADLANSINRLGGNAYLLPKLTKGTDTYTLISSNDPTYVQQHQQLEITSLRGEYESGEVAALLGKDHSNRLGVKEGLADAKLGRTMGAEWTQVAFQQAQDWPAWTPAQEAAYLDLTSSANHYPSIRRGLGCGGANDECQPIRSYYDGGIGAGTAPPVFSLDYNSLTYVSNTDYGPEDLKAVTDQLDLERGYEKNVYHLYSLFSDMTTDQAASWQVQLQKVASAIDSSVVKNDARVTVNGLNKAAAVIQLLSFIPGAGPAFGGVSSVLYATAQFVPAENGLPNDTKYGYTLQQLKDKSTFIGSDMAATLIDVFTGIVSDWGKVSVIGAGYGSKQVPWYMCISCSESNIPRAALPANALGAKRQFYLQLMPTVFIDDVLTGQKTQNPAKIGGWVPYGQGGGRWCEAVYNDAPAQSYWSYPNISNPSTWDLFIITNIRVGHGPNNWYQTRSFPSDALLTDLFSAPSTSGGILSGGAGFTQDQLMPSYAYMGQRPGEIPRADPCAP